MSIDFGKLNDNGIKLIGLFIELDNSLIVFLGEGHVIMSFQETYQLFNKLHNVHERVWIIPVFSIVQILELPLSLANSMLQGDHFIPKTTKPV